MTIGIATGVLALRPWHGLYLDAAGGAIHPAHGVGERNGDVPDRDELELAGPGHSVISGTRLFTAGTSGFGVGPRDDHGDGPRLVSFAIHSDGMINEGLEAVGLVE